MKKIQIGEATVPQLRYHAETVLGLEVPRIANSGQLKAKIEAAAPGTTEITVADEVESPAQVQAEKNTVDATAAAAQEREQQAEVAEASFHGMNAKQAAAHHNDPTIEVKVLLSDKAGGERDVPVSVNGIQWLLQRDKWVKVPYRVFEALQHAEETKYELSNNDIGQMQSSERQVPSYPFQTQNGPSEAEIASWRKRTESVELA
jgi:hypothetical protein